MFRVGKIIENKDGSADIAIFFDPKKVYPIVREAYGVKRGSKKLVERFVKEAVMYQAKKAIANKKNK